MLIPRFSIRLMLVLTAVCAVFFLLVSFAGDGSHFAAGIVIVILTIIFAMLAYAAVFLLAYAFARLFRLVRPESQPASPFATDSLPPQVIPPQNPE